MPEDTDATSLAVREAKRLHRRPRVEFLAFVAQIVSALAVVISLVFVGIQLNEGNTVTLRNESNATMAPWSAFRGSIYSDRDTARVFQSAMDADPPLDAADRLRFHYLLREHAWATFQIWDRAKRNLLPTSNFEVGAAPDFLAVICTPGGAPTWADIRGNCQPPMSPILSASRKTTRPRARSAVSRRLSCNPQSGRAGARGTRKSSPRALSRFRPRARRWAGPRLLGPRTRSPRRPCRPRSRY